MKKLWIAAGLLAGAQGCSMMGMNRQVVIAPSMVDDFRSPAWIVHSVPAGARMPGEEPDD